MQPQILGISGSPIKNSNTDRIVKHVLATSGLESEFIKLSSVNVRPCRACKKCVKDNICKVKDDFQAIAENLKTADAIVIGSYCPYSTIDAYTKAFLERLWSLRHVNNLMKGKIVVTAVTGLAPQITGKVNEILAMEMNMERMNLIGQIDVTGNVPCLTCGEGDDCEMSGVPLLFGEGAKASADKCVAVEDQAEIWNQAESFGKQIRNLLNKQ